MIGPLPRDGALVVAFGEVEPFLNDSAVLNTARPNGETERDLKSRSQLITACRSFEDSQLSQSIKSLGP